MLKILMDRLKERSTWIGLTTVITAAGVSMNPEQIEAVITAGVAVVGAIFAFTRDNPEAEKPTANGNTITSNTITSNTITGNTA